MHIFVWYFLVTSWWSVCRLAFCSLYYNGLGFGGLGLFVYLGGFSFVVCFFFNIIGWWGRSNDVKTGLVTQDLSN